MITEYAHIDFAHEGLLFDQVLVRMGCLALSRTRIEFEFEFIREQDGMLLCKGRCAIMPDSLSTAQRDITGLPKADRND